MKARFLFLVGLTSLPLSIFAQGSLTPPGTPAPTMKSLDQVEARTAIDPRQSGFTYPYTISRSGSYYLAANLTPGSGKSAIVINSNYVTVDLNGFSVTGVNSSGVSAIQVGNTAGLGIRNGKVNNWSNANGAISTIADGALFEKLIVTDNSDGPGLVTGQGCTIKDCIAKNNAIGTNQSGGGGIGIYTGNGCTVVNCTAYGNGAAGIQVGSGGSLVSCSLLGNGGDGIVAGSISSFTNCSAESNGGFGINAYLACTVSGCAAGSNQNSGIKVSDASTVNGCTAFFNTHNGIVCSSRCHIINNNCTENDSGGQTTDAGIIATGNGNTIDSNESDSNESGGGGYILSGTNNLLIRNSATGNGYNYNVGSGNTYGPIINMSSGGVISSSSGTVNPWTNWIH